MEDTNVCSYSHIFLMGILYHFMKEKKHGVRSLKLTLFDEEYSSKNSILIPDHHWINNKFFNIFEKLIYCIDDLIHFLLFKLKSDFINWYSGCLFSLHWWYSFNSIWNTLPFMNKNRYWINVKFFFYFA